MGLLYSKPAATHKTVSTIWTEAQNLEEPSRFCSWSKTCNDCAAPQSPVLIYHRVGRTYSCCYNRDRVWRGEKWGAQMIMPARFEVRMEDRSCFEKQLCQIPPTSIFPPPATTPRHGRGMEKGVPSALLCLSLALIYNKRRLKQN